MLKRFRAIQASNGKSRFVPHIGRVSRIGVFDLVLFWLLMAVCPEPCPEHSRRVIEGSSPDGFDGFFDFCHVLRHPGCATHRLPPALSGLSRACRREVGVSAACTERPVPSTSQFLLLHPPNKLFDRSALAVTYRKGAWFHC